MQVWYRFADLTSRDRYAHVIKVTILSILMSFNVMLGSMFRFLSITLMEARYRFRRG